MSLSGNTGINILLVIARSAESLSLPPSPSHSIACLEGGGEREALPSGEMCGEEDVLSVTSPLPPPVDLSAKAEGERKSMTLRCRSGRGGVVLLCFCLPPLVII